MDEQLNEMRKLYEVEKRTLKEIGRNFGVSAQTVSNRLAKAGVPKRPKTSRKIILDREVLHKLYVNEKLPVKKVARLLKTYGHKVSDELKRHGIEKRSIGYNRRKYPGLYQLKIDEQMTIPLPLVTKPHKNLHQKAERIGIRISIERIGDKTLQITRIK